MFLILNRIFRAGIVLAWCGAALGVWSQRERARPALDYYQLWRDAGWQRPDPLPRWSGQLTRFVSPGVIDAVDTDGRKWRFNLVGLGTLNPNDPQFAATNRAFLRVLSTNLQHRFLGQPVEVALVESQPNRTGSGFLYHSNQLASLAWVLDGWYWLKPEECRRLPLTEQYRLRLADRSAQVDLAGLWRPPFSLSIAASERSK